MPLPVTPGRRRKFRRWFRWCRMTLLISVLLLLGSLVYLNRVGLRGFVTARLVSRLRARGVKLNFTRLRLRWYHGLVAENISLGRADDPFGPHLSMAEADIRLDPAALRRLRLHVDSLQLHDGRLVLPLISSNGPPERFVVNGIMTELRLLPEDRWELDHFQASCLGAKINLSGTLANASAVRDWQFARGTNQPPGLWQTQLRQAVTIAKQMRFGRPPEIMVTVNGDARIPAGISVYLRCRAREA